MTRDEVLAMAEQAGFAVYKFEAYRPQNRTLVQGDSFNAERFHTLAFEAGRKAADQDRVDAERYRWIKENETSKDFDFGAPFIVIDCCFSGHDLDAAIDRERSAK